MINNDSYYEVKNIKANPKWAINSDWTKWLFNQWEVYLYTD